MPVLTSINIFNDLLHKDKAMVGCECPSSNTFFCKKNYETDIIFCLRCMSCICGPISAAM
jgi:hypothetical protein